MNYRNAGQSLIAYEEYYRIGYCVLREIYIQKINQIREMD